jgi:hypothetical protein
MKVIKVNSRNEVPQNYTGIVECFDDTKYWILNGKLHREDGPAIEWANGDKEWYWNGWLHREDGPARESLKGSKWWFLNGKQHRENGPAVELFYGHKEWYLNGKHHREDGPAYEDAEGDKSWYLNDEHLFRLPPESQPFIFLEEFVDEEGKKQIKILNQEGIEIWPNLPGLKEYADNWQALKQ